MILLWGIACWILYSKGLISVECIALGALIALCHDNIDDDLDNIRRRIK